MRIELRILSGARAGQTEIFDKSQILIGRKPTTDLRFDTHGDLDVSGDHAEIIEIGGRWYVSDSGSTNGTYVNGDRIGTKTEIRDGDVIGFGRNGPTVEVRAKGDATGKTPAIPRTQPRPSVKAPVRSGPSTHERVAVEVRNQTRGMKSMLIGSMVGLGALAVVAYWIGTREGSRKMSDMQKALAQAESTSAQLRDRVRTGDTVLAKALQKQFDSLRAKATDAASRGNEQQIAAMRAEIERNRVRQEGLAALDFTTISERNDPAVAFLMSDVDGQLLGGTAFGVTKDGMLVTNRHNVRSAATGAMATKIQIVFSNTSGLMPAHVVKVADDSLELALIQLDKPGSYPVVAGISATGNVRPGAALVTIGFPYSLDLPMQGNRVNTTLSPGTARKRIPGLLQIDAYGAHGMSGSPVFDDHGVVVGVVWGGPKNSPQITYAVPSDLLVNFLGGAAKDIIR
jgi:pSer/pThr/pTyr-binding forkhead associated (FHA) protein/S1-C subfamily serine protease